MTITVVLEYQRWYCQQFTEKLHRGKAAAMAVGTADDKVVVPEQDKWLSSLNFNHLGRSCTSIQTRLQRNRFGDVHLATAGRAGSSHTTDSRTLTSSFFGITKLFDGHAALT